MPVGVPAMPKRTKRTPEQREAMKYAYWNKWGGGDPDKVLRSNKIDYDDPWYISDIKNVTNTTPSEFDNDITK